MPPDDDPEFIIQTSPGRFFRRWSATEIPLGVAERSFAFRFTNRDDLALTLSQLHERGWLDATAKRVTRPTPRPNAPRLIERIHATLDPEPDDPCLVERLGSDGKPWWLGSGSGPYSTWVKDPDQAVRLSVGADSPARPGSFVTVDGYDAYLAQPPSGDWIDQPDPNFEEIAEMDAHVAEQERDHRMEAELNSLTKMLARVPPVHTTVLDRFRAAIQAWRSA